MNAKVYPVVFMVVASTVATALLTGAQIVLRPKIVVNEQARMQRARLDGLGLLPPEATVEQVQEIYKKQVKTAKVDDQEAYFGLGEDGQVKAVGLEFAGMGFWGPIKGLLSLNPKLDEIEGIVFIEQQETPGLGARMMDPWFRDQFKKKKAEKLTWLPEGTGAEGPTQVNAISGATRTTDSLKTILNQQIDEFQKLAPALRKEMGSDAGGGE